MISLRKYICIAIIAILFPNIVCAVVKTTVASGNWNNAAIWSPSGVPAASDQAVISSGNNVTVSSTQTINQTTVSSGATLTWSNSSILTMTGKFTVSGTVDMNGGNITLSTPGLQFILNSGSVFTWNPGTNTSSAATLLTNGVESFDSLSTFIIKKWYDYTVPLANNMNGDYGTININSKNSSNIIVEWNQNNKFESHHIKGSLIIDEGWITLDKSSSISSTTIGSIQLLNANSIFYAHNGNHSSSFTIATNSITNTQGTFYGIADGNGNIQLNVSGNFTNSGNVKLINNSGVASVSNGNATIIVGGTFSQSAGDTRLIYNITTTNCGVYAATFNNVLLNGGIFFGQTGVHTGGGTCSFRVLSNFTINFSSSADKFRGTSLTSIGAYVNNSKFDFDVDGAFSYTGVSSSSFISSASNGTETNDIVGNFSVNGGACSFNYGTSACAHSTTINVGGNVIVSTGSLYFSRNDGALTATITGNISLTGGNIIVKGNNGLANLTLNGNYNQSGGIFYMHSNGTVATPDVVTMSVKNAFAQTLGTFNFDDNSSNSSARHELRIDGPTINLGGNGIITKGGVGTSSVYGLINFSRSGAIDYTRSSTTHAVSQTKYFVSNGTTLNVSNGNILLSSALLPATDFFIIGKGGTVNMNLNQFTSNGLLTSSGIMVDSSGRLITRNPYGLYNGTMSATISTVGNLDYYLNENSIVEYNGSVSQILSGYGYGLMNGTQHKYGILDINFTGPTTTERVRLMQNQVVRKRVILRTGFLDLNNYALTLENGLTNAVVRTSGILYGESAVSNNNSMLRWQNMQAGIHEFPFGNTNGYTPILFEPLIGMGGEVSISTSSTSPTNTPLPFAIAPGLGLDSNAIDPISSTTAEDEMIDRWWTISAPGFTANVTLKYAANENTMMPSMQTGIVKAVQWTGTDWSNPVGLGTGVTSGTGTVVVNNTSAFSTWGLRGMNSTLPIELIYFKPELEGNEVIINWSTAAEINNDYFNVEKSNDGISFESIMQIPGAGNSTTQKNYSVIDKYPFEGDNFYRLKQTDFDGRFAYSAIEILSYKKKSEASISIESLGPNPFGEGFTANIMCNEEGQAEMKIQASDGREIYNGKLELSKGNNKFNYTDGSLLTPGIYIFTISKDNFSESKKIIKK